jgi:hypothetical protein
VAASQALDWVGLPEAQYALAQATTYIATAPKSNRSGLAYFAAAGDVEAHGSLPVPLHLRNAPHRLMRQHGIGVGYKYSQDFEGADVDQQYLPDELVERRYYLPTDQGYEATIAGRQAARAEARDAARAAAAPGRNPNPDARGRQERHDADPRVEPEEAGRDREARRRRLTLTGLRYGRPFAGTPRRSRTPGRPATAPDRGAAGRPARGDPGPAGPGPRRS